MEKNYYVKFRHANHDWVWPIKLIGNNPADGWEFNIETCSANRDAGLVLSTNDIFETDDDTIYFENGGCSEYEIITLEE